MKVLHVFNCYLPKTEVWAYYLLSNMKNVDTYVAAKYYKNKSYKNTNWKFADYDKRFDLQKSLELETNSVKSIVQKIGLKVKTMGTEVFGSQLANTIDQVKPAICHFHFGTTAIEHQEFIKKTGVKTVVSFYGMDYIRAAKNNENYYPQLKKLFKQADLFVVEGDWGKNFLIEKGCSPKKIRVNRLGIQVPEFRAKKRSKKGTLRLVQIASLTEKKGQWYTLLAFKEALKKNPNIELTLVGDKRDVAYADRLFDFIELNKLSDQVHYKDWISTNELRSFLSDFDVFIHPSVHAKDGDCEGGIPTILFHAMAAGLPIIGTKHCDLPDAIVDSQNGITVEEESIDELASAILSYTKLSTEDYQRQSEAGQTILKEKFDIVENAKSLEGLYGEGFV